MGITAADSMLFINMAEKAGNIVTGGQKSEEVQVIEQLAGQILPYLLSGIGGGSGEASGAQSDVQKNTQKANELKVTLDTQHKQNSAQMQIIINKLHTQMDAIQQNLKAIRETDAERQKKQQELDQQREAINTAAKTLNESNDPKERQKALETIKASQGVISSLSVEVTNLKTQSDNLQTELSNQESGVSATEAEGQQQGTKTQTDLSTGEQKARVELQNNNAVVQKGGQNAAQAKTKHTEAAAMAATSPTEAARVEAEAADLDAAATIRKQGSQAPKATVTGVQTSIGVAGQETNSAITAVGSESQGSYELVSMCNQLFDGALGWLNNDQVLADQANGELPQAISDAEDVLSAQSEGPVQGDNNDAPADEGENQQDDQEIFRYDIDQLDLK